VVGVRQGLTNSYGLKIAHEREMETGSVLWNWCKAMKGLEKEVYRFL
jgi:hypothetical protein